MRNVVQFKDKDDNLYAVKDIVARQTKADAANLYNYKTATGDIVSVDDAEAESAKRMQIAIDPVQDLHGQDAPYPAGGGKNLFKFFQNGYISATGDITGSSYTNNGVTDYFPVTAETSYTIGTKESIKGIIVGWYTSAKEFISRDSYSYTASKTVSSPQNTAFCRVSINIDDTTAVSDASCQEYKVQFELGSTKTDYAPFENVCPISGWTGCNVTRTGKNLIGFQVGTTGTSAGVTYTVNADGSINCSGVSTGTSYGIGDTNHIVLQPGTYVLSVTGATNMNTRLVNDATSTYSTITGSGSLIIQPTEPTEYHVYNHVSSGKTINETISIQLEFGSIASEYEPFAGIATYQIAFPSSAGTVYGGELTINRDGTGSLVVDETITTLTGNESGWQYYSGQQVFYNYFSQYVDDAVSNPDAILMKCSVYNAVSLNVGKTPSTRPGYCCYKSSGTGGASIAFSKDNFDDLTAFLNYLKDQNTAGTPVQVTAKLASPVTYQLTNQQVLELLAGTNNIWSSTGSIEIDYPVAKLITKDDADKSYAGMIYEETESAPIVSIADGTSVAPVKTLEVQIEPVQDLHGYDSPWPAGGGKNKLKITGTSKTEGNLTYTVYDDRIIVNGNSGTGSAFAVNITLKDELEDGQTYILSGCPSGGSYSTYSLYLYSTPGYAIDARDTGSGVQFTKAMGTDTSINLYINIRANIDMNNAVFKPMIRLSTITDATFAPYENVCPISGWDSAEASRTGINIWDEETRSGYYDSVTGEFKSQSSTLSNKNMIPVMPNTTYYCKSGTYRVNTSYFDKYMHYISGGYHKENSTFTTPANCYFMGFNNDFGAGATYSDDISINYLSTDTQYHAYSGETIEYEFPDAAGTVYGGTLTIHQDGSGELVVDHVSRTLLNTWGWRLDGSGTDRRFALQYGALIPTAANKNGTYICSHLKPENLSTNSNAFGNFYISGGWLVINDNTNHFADLNEFKSWIESETVDIVYELATPVTYQLTNHQVLELLKGNNVCFADCGSISLEYPADTKLYIDGKIAEIQALILENISNS